MNRKDSSNYFPQYNSNQKNQPVYPPNYPQAIPAPPPQQRFVQQQSMNVNGQPYVQVQQQIGNPPPVYPSPDIQINPRYPQLPGIPPNMPYQMQPNRGMQSLSQIPMILPIPQTPIQYPPQNPDQYSPPQPTVLSPQPPTNSSKKYLSNMEKFKDYIIDLNDFQFEKNIGTGSFGSVSKAKNKYTGWSVAIKQLNTSNLPAKQVEFFKREVKILLQCNNPFLLDFVGFSLEPQLSIVTTFMNQGSLWDLLHKYPNSITPTQKTNIAIGVCHGMRYLHSKGIIHRDLKSPNILLDNRLFPYVADFGLGRIIEKAIEGLPPMTNCAGTPNWMAPEQIATENYGFPVDVYAFGMILYELATSRFPFEGLKQHEIFSRVTQGHRPELPSSLDGTSLAELIKKCWDQDPNNRPTFDHIYNMFYMRDVDFPGTEDSGVDLMLHFIDRHESTISLKSRASILNEILKIRSRVQQSHSSSSSIRPLCMYATAGSIEDFFNNFLAYVDSDVNCQDPENSNKAPLHCAAYNGHLAMIEFLTMINGIDLNIVDSNKDTPLSIAVQLRHRDVVKLLISCKGINPNIQNQYGATPLHYATVMREVEIVKILLSSKDIDVTIKDLYGHTALEMAQQKKNAEIIQLLTPC